MITADVFPPSAAELGHDPAASIEAARISFRQLARAGNLDTSAPA